MSGSKPKRQIRKLVQLLISRYDVPSVYVEDIVWASLLDPKADVIACPGIDGYNDHIILERRNAPVLLCQCSNSSTRSVPRKNLWLL
jgi:hypothetical protein